MRPVGHWLTFEVSDADDGTLTLEGMASVAPGQLPQVWAEVHWALSHMCHLTGSPAAALDQGGEWDMLLQMQCDSAPAISLPWRADDTDHTPPLVGSGVHWVSIALTLVTREQLAATVLDTFVPDGSD